MDFAPDNMSSNVMTSALNATLLTFNGNEMLLQNDMGNGRVETARLPDGYIPVGSCEFGDIIYIVSYNPILNKSQVGCFPSPERNISSEEIGDLGQAISSSDFQELKDGNPTGKLKANSVKKVLYGSKNMNSGDKYIIYSDDLNADNTKHLSDYGNLSHRHGMFPKLVKIHIVSIEESGKIVHLDSNTKWYDNNYYISADGQKNSEGKLDIDSYRTLVSSAYSIFSSKVSGKLALLIELEKITGFSCSWEPYIESTSVEKGINYTNYLIHWNFNWTTDDNNINPNGALLLNSEWKGLSTKIGVWRKDGNKLIQEFKELNDISLPDVYTEGGPSILFTRSYLPEDCSDYKSFIENNYESEKNKQLSKFVNPCKINIDVDFETGLPNIGNYYINSVRSEHNTDMFTVQNPKLNLNKNTEQNIQKIFISDNKLYAVTENEIYINESNRFNLNSTSIGTIIDVCSGNGYLYVLTTNNKIYRFEESNVNTISATYNLEKSFQGIDYHDGYFYMSHNNSILKVKSFESLNDPNGYTSTKINFSGIVKCYRDSILIANNNTLRWFSLEGRLLIEKTFKNPIKSITVYKNEIYVLTSDPNNSSNLLDPNNPTNKYEINTYNITYYTKMYDNDNEQIEVTSLNDDIVNNYFNYPVIKPFTVIKNSYIENHIFKIPVSQTFDNQTLSTDISNLVYYYKFAPTMPYGYLEEYSQEGYIDFSKIGKKDISLNTWKYYNYGNTSTLTWGLDAYTEPGKGISEVVFEFYDNQGLAAAYHSKNKRSYNGVFTEHLILNDSINKHLTNVDHTGRIFRHKGRKVSSKDQMLDDRVYYNGKWYSKNSTIDGTTYDEDDAGIIYSNCLYLVKIIVKYCNKGILGEYIESGLEYVYDYRWYWTNGLFNEYYINTSDFSILQFKLDLDCFTHLYTAENYQVNTYNYQSPNTNTNNRDNIYNSLSANIQAINIDGQSNDNIKLALTLGLLNTYNTFNLNEDAINQFKVNIYLGDEYIKNIEPQPAVLYSKDSISVDSSYIQPLSDSILNQPEANPVVQSTETQDYGISTVLIEEENSNDTFKENWIRPEDDIVVEGGSGTTPVKLSVGISVTNNNNKIEITSTAESNSILYYTDDGTTPIKNEEKKYNELFPITGDTTIRVLAVPSNTKYQDTYYTKVVKYIPENPEESTAHGKILGNEVSQTLHDLLNNDFTVTNPENKEIWDSNESYKNYVNKFILDSTLEYDVTAETFSYQASNGEYKSIKGCPRYTIAMNNILFKPDNPYDTYFPLTLSGIHYSKYLYLNEPQTNSKILRSFVLTPNDLNAYNIDTYCNDSGEYIPYFNKMLTSSMADSGGTNAHQYTAILNFTRDVDELVYKLYSSERISEYNKNQNGNISLESGLNEAYDKITEKFTFMFPFGYARSNADLNFEKASIDGKEVSTNRNYNEIEQVWGNNNKDLGGTLAAISEDRVEPADSHLTEDNPNILEEAARVVTGYLTQLFYLTDTQKTDIWQPSNFIYLEPNQYSYKRDIIIQIKPISDNKNNLILMRGIAYADYIDETSKTSKNGYISEVLTKVFKTETEISKYKNSPNVNLKLETYIQTKPLEYIAEYQEPDTYVEQKLGVQSIFTDIPIYANQYIDPDTVYGWNDNTKSFNPIGGIYKLKYINYFDEVDSETGTLKTKFNNQLSYFSLGKINSERCLSIDGDLKLNLKKYPTMSSNTYTVKTEEEYGLTGFRKGFKLYEPVQ